MLTWPMLEIRHISHRRNEKHNTGTKITVSVIDKTIAINTFEHSLLNIIEERSKNKEAQSDCFHMSMTL